MGYLDNSTITVDAILTKKGRMKLAEGQPLGIDHFNITDTGIDYTLWNPDHPSGSKYYGEAIENLPQVEAVPQGEYFMRNKLATYDRNVTAMPLVRLGGLTTPGGITFIDLGDSVTVDASVYNWTGPATFNWWIRNVTFLVITPTPTAITETGIQNFVPKQDIHQAAVVRGASSVTFQPIAESQTFVTDVMVEESHTGAWTEFTIEKKDTLHPIKITENPRGPQR